MNLYLLPALKKSWHVPNQALVCLLDPWIVINLGFQLAQINRRRKEKLFLKSHPLIATVSGTEIPFCPSLCSTLQRVPCSAPRRCSENKCHSDSGMVGAVFWYLGVHCPVLQGCGVLLQSHLCGYFQFLLGSSEVTGVAMVSRGRREIKGVSSVFFSPQQPHLFQQ